LTVDIAMRVDEDPDGVEATLVDELDRLANVGPSDADLDRVRILRRTEHASEMERTQERADRIGMYASLLDAPERVDEEVARYEAIGRDAVRDFVARFLVPDRAVRLLYLPTA
jgi:predicted Zn-dependent peptidase